MPRFTDSFTEEEISFIHEAVDALRDEAERNGYENRLETLDTLLEKLGDWS